MMAVGERMSGHPLGAEMRPVVQTMAEEEARRAAVPSNATFATPVRHVHRTDEADGPTHWISGSVPWDEPTPPDRMRLRAPSGRRTLRL